MRTTPHGTSASDSSVLDNPMWSAMTGPQAALTELGGRARRFASDIAPFAGVPEPSDENFQALAQLLHLGEDVALFTTVALSPPSELEISMQAMGVQMVAGPELRPPATTVPLLTLSDRDAPEMLALAELTKPGPFRTRTHELGGFLGVRDDSGTLIAMAGERLQMPGYTEISAVCTHPDHRGKQLAHHLVLAVAGRIRARGDNPMLHAFANNAPAIALYEKLGFHVRTTLHVTLLRLAVAPSARAGE